MVADSGKPAGVESELICIGEWQFHPGLNRLRNADKVVHLEPKASQALMLLAQRGGEPVSRQELLEGVWSNVVVSDDALTQVVIKLRKAFGDTSRNSRYIQTIPKQGYCLVAALRRQPSPPAGDAPGSAEQRIGVKRIPSWGMLLAVLVALLALAYLFSLTLPYGQDPSDGGAVAVDGDSPTIAVIPFEASTQNEREQRFARGVTADLTTDLSSLSDLWVISTSAVQGGLPDTRYLLSGSVQQADERIGVHVRLLETATQRQLWSKRYEKPIDDLFNVQRFISRDVVQQLSVEVSAADLQRLASRYTPSLAAYEDFLRGQAQLLLRQEDANSSARQWYRQAIEKDPNFARAYAGLALSHAADYRNHWVEDGAGALRLAREMAQTGAQIDPGISEVYWVLGYVAAQHRRHQEALEHLGKALQLDRSYADAHALMGGINTYLGNPRISIGQLRNAMRLNQGAGYLYYLLLGRAYYFTGQYQQALINLRESLARNPVNLEARIYLVVTSVARNDQDTAAWETDEIRAIEPGFSVPAWLDTYPMTDVSQRGQLADALTAAGL